MIPGHKKNYKTLIWTLAVVINLLIAATIYIPKMGLRGRYDFSILPFVNAILNSITFLALMIALFAIRQKNIRVHKTFVFLALVSTAGFLVCYLTYHFTTPSTKYGDEGILRYIYYFILLTHVILAIIIVPLALLTLGYGLNLEVEKHRKIARWTMPIWLYVSLTGVIVYLMTSPYYTHVH